MLTVLASCDIIVATLNLDKAKKGANGMLKGTIDNWQYVGVPGKRQVQGIIEGHVSGSEGMITTSPIITYDHVTGTITTKSGNRYRLGSPIIVDYQDGL